MLERESKDNRKSLENNADDDARSSAVTKRTFFG
jgi:hypothetical protein